VNDAIEAYEAALAREGTYDLHRANLSALYAQAGRLEDARAEMETAYATQSTSTVYPFWLGGYAEAAGDTEAATEWYALALLGKPEWAASGYWQAAEWRTEFWSDQIDSAADDGWIALLLAAGDEVTALRVAEEEAAAQPGDFTAQLTLGEVGLRAGNPDVALSALDAALAVDDSSPTAYALRAEARLATGDTDGAQRDARTAIFLASSGDAGRRGRYVLAQLAEMAGDLEAAEEGYLAAGPVVVVGQGWDVSVYGRKADFRYLPQMQTPGQGLYAIEPWLALAELYEAQGRAADAEAIDAAIRAYDPYAGD
jgi:tetratricopeptide (TPR) repeat protein